MSNDRIDEMLARHYARESHDDAEGARVVAKLGALPPQKHRLWTRIPGILLDWQFAPAWPRMAALACCAVSSAPFVSMYSSTAPKTRWSSMLVLTLRNANAEPRRITPIAASVSGR